MTIDSKLVSEWCTTAGFWTNGWMAVAVQEVAQRAYDAGRKAGMEEAAALCDAYENDQWALYKGRPPYKGNEDGRASPDVQGRSDGAGECASKIREASK